MKHFCIAKTVGNQEKVTSFFDSVPWNKLKKFGASIPF